MFSKVTPRMRRRLMGTVLLFLALLVWWKYGMAPLTMSRTLIEEEIDMLSMEKERLLLRRSNLAAMDLDGTAYHQELAILSPLLMGGRRVEELNAATHQQIQEILERYGLTLKSWRELGAVPWRAHQLGRIQLQLDTTMEGLAQLLLALDELEKAIRLDNLTVRYRRTRGDDLQVMMEFGALFVRHTALQ